MTPEEEEQVARALAATARGEGDGGPLPPEVGDHLDALLGDLSRARAIREAERSGAARTSAGAGTEPGSGDELAARRRRRWPEVLVAAATVAVIALAGGAVATGGFGLSGGGASSDSAGSSSAADSEAQKSVPESGGSSEAGGGSSSGDASAPEALTSGAGPFRLRTARLRADVAKVAQATRRDTGLSAQEDRRDQPDDAFVGCARPDVGSRQTLVDVLLDGDAASLVLDDRPGPDGTRAARVYSCDDPAEPVTETSVR